MREIYLVRHGIPAFPNGKTIIQGSTTDLPLNPECLEDAKGLASFFDTLKIDNWYSSPLKRARQTLQQFCPEPEKIQILENAIEVNFGRWEGKSWLENKQSDPELFEKRLLDNTVLPPDAEPMREAAERFKKAILSTEGNCVIATHWTVISLIYCTLEGFPLEKYLDVPHPYLGITKLTEQDGTLKVNFAGQRLTPCPNCLRLEKAMAGQHNDGKI